MDSIRIQNIRSIKDSETIELKPITVAIGKNSCGKSTFIRTFPLLKQSLEKNVSESLLWYGDYVDFGSFESIKPYNDMSNDPVIELSTKILLPFRTTISNKNEVKINLRMVLSKKYIKEYTIDYFDQTITVFLNENSTIGDIVINGQSMQFNKSDYTWVKMNKELIPTFSPNKRKNTLFWAFSFKIDEAEDHIVQALKKICDPRTKEATIKEITEKTNFFLSKNELKKVLSSNSKCKTISSYFSENNIDDEVFKNINNNMVLLMFPPMVQFINGALNTETTLLHYLKPIRANANRYYRIQGVSTNKLDSDGSNLPMILYNMKDTELQDFENWSFEKFGITFSVSSDSGHVSLVAKTDEKLINLADTGYGYSQILPVILQLWLLSKEEKDYSFRGTNIFVIEQPELHLHPAFQAKIIDAFANIVSSAKENKIDVKIIFETHSETMVNRLGYLIYKKRLNKDLVNILIFDKENDSTIIKSRGFNDKGLIEGWPMGFFSVED